MQIGIITDALTPNTNIMNGCSKMNEILATKVVTNQIITQKHFIGWKVRSTGQVR